MSAFPPVQFDPRRLTDETLAALRRLTTDRIDGMAPRFGEWLYRWCDAEAYWRSTDAEHRPARHALAVPPAAEWSTADLVDALHATICMEFLAQPEAVGVFLDRLRLGLAEVLKDRFRGAETPQGDNS